MKVERMAKYPDDFKKGLLITPMGRCHISQAYSIFLEQNPGMKIDNFLMLYGGKFEVLSRETSFKESNILSKPIEKFLKGSKFIKSYVVMLILSLSDLS